MYEGGRYACIERKIKNYNTYKKGKKMDRKLGDDTSSRIPSYTQEEKITIVEKALTSSMTPKNKEVHIIKWKLVTEKIITYRFNEGHSKHTFIIAIRLQMMQRMSLKTTSFNNCIMKLMQHQLMIFYSIMATSMPKLKAAMKVESILWGNTGVER